MRSSFKLLELFRKFGIRYLENNSKIAKEVIARPGGWKALDLVYGNDPYGQDGAGTFIPKKFFDRMFFYSSAAEATRERLKEFEKMLVRLIKYYGNKGLRILSIASGPGRDILNLVEEHRNADIEATCIDIDQEAISMGRRLAEKKGVSDKVIYKRGNAKRIDEYEDEKKYHIVVTQGFLDYLSFEDSLVLLRKVYTILRPGGHVVVCNMNRHSWMRFWMEFFGGWRLNYKTENSVKKILDECGYMKTEVFTESRGLHFIGRGTKP